MKRLLISATSSVLLVSVNTIAAAEPRQSQSPLNYHMHKALTDMCISIAKDRPDNMRRTMKSYRLSYKVIGQKLVCNGKGVVAWAEHSGNQRTAKDLRRKIGEYSVDELAINWGEPIQIQLEN